MIVEALAGVAERVVVRQAPTWACAGEPSTSRVRGTRASTACFPLAMAMDVGLCVVLLGGFLHGLGLEIFSVSWDLAIRQNGPPEKLAALALLAPSVRRLERQV